MGGDGAGDQGERVGEAEVSDKAMEEEAKELRNGNSKYEKKKKEG